MSKPTHHWATALKRGAWDGRRGASLGRQLLTFARRQPLKAEPVDLQTQLTAMQGLLDRALRGDVHVTMDFAEDLWAVLVDPAELELVLLKLCVNARDAIRTIGSHPEMAGKVLQGRTSFRWAEGGAFLMMRTQIDEPEFPDGCWTSPPDRREGPVQCRSRPSLIVSSRQPAFHGL